MTSAAPLGATSDDSAFSSNDCTVFDFTVFDFTVAPEATVSPFADSVVFGFADSVVLDLVTGCTAAATWIALGALMFGADSPFADSVVLDLAAGCTAAAI